MPPHSQPLILGIDPGTLRTGYGLITQAPVPACVGHGTISPKASLPIEERLHLIHQDLLELIDHHRPVLIAVEEPFFGKSPKSSMAVGQAQAIALIAAASRRIPLLKFPPAQVKQRTTGNGAATKEQIRIIVQATLSIPGRLTTDASDALAVALCAVAQQQEDRVLAATAAPDVPRP